MEWDYRNVDEQGDTGINDRLKIEEMVGKYE